MALKNVRTAGPLNTRSHRKISSSRTPARALMNMPPAKCAQALPTRDTRFQIRIAAMIPEVRSAHAKMYQTFVRPAHRVVLTSQTHHSPRSLLDQLLNQPPIAKMMRAPKAVEPKVEPSVRALSELRDIVFYLHVRICHRKVTCIRYNIKINNAILY